VKISRGAKILCKGGNFSQEKYTFVLWRINFLALYTQNNTALGGVDRRRKLTPGNIISKWEKDDMEERQAKNTLARVFGNSPAMYATLTHTSSCAAAGYFLFRAARFCLSTYPLIRLLTKYGHEYLKIQRILKEAAARKREMQIYSGRG